MPQCVECCALRTIVCRSVLYDAGRVGALPERVSIRHVYALLAKLEHFSMHIYDVESLPWRSLTHSVLRIHTHRHTHTGLNGGDCVA